MSYDPKTRPGYDPRTWLSVSKWNAITKCGELYRLERIEKKPSRPAAWTVRGIAVHTTIEEWEKSDRTTDPEALYVQAWRSAADETESRFPDVNGWIKTPRVGSVQKDMVLREKDGLQQVQRYVERAEAESDLWRVAGTEVKFTLEYPLFVIRGYIDQILEWYDGDLTLRDIKTGGDDSENDRQLSLYSYGYEAETGKVVEFGDYWYTKLDRPSKPIKLRRYSEAFIEQELLKVKQILDLQLFLANPSIKNCFSCPVSEFCLESKATNV